MQDIVVLKCGGSSIDDLSEMFFENIKMLMSKGVKPVIVHGGGPAIKDLLSKLDIEFEFVDGLRKTTDEIMDVVEMVLSGHVNSSLTRCANRAGMQTIGLSGTDSNLLVAEPIDYDRYGLVGEVTGVNTKLLTKIIDIGLIPVISPVALCNKGKRYNVNADTAAGAIAKALGAKQLVFVTDVDGILKDEQLLEEVTINDVENLIKDGTIYGGMIPKVKAALNGLAGDVSEVKIVNGKHSELTRSHTLKGTIIKKNEE